MDKPIEAPQPVTEQEYDSMTEFFLRYIVVPAGIVVVAAVLVSRRRGSRWWVRKAA